MNNNSIGIMQGRLSPRYNERYQAFPPDNWKDEFQRAKSIGFDCIEFIYDYENYNESPLITRKGVNEIKEIMATTGVKVLSVCADFFMNNRLFDLDSQKRKNNIDHLKNLIEKSSVIGVKDITVPFVDNSSLKNSRDLENARVCLLEILPLAGKYGVNINIEADLPPMEFHGFLKRLNHQSIKVNYDIGNSASLGYDPEEEMLSYGSYISVLHVKDRVRGGGSVKLGSGNADFEKVFKNLKKLDFNGVIIMQAARAESYADEMKFVTEQFDFLKNCLERWYY